MSPPLLPTVESAGHDLQLSPGAVEMWVRGVECRLSTCQMGSIAINVNGALCEKVRCVVSQLEGIVFTFQTYVDVCSSRRDNSHDNNYAPVASISVCFCISLLHSL